MEWVEGVHDSVMNAVNGTLDTWMLSAGRCPVDLGLTETRVAISQSLTTPTYAVTMLAVPSLATLERQLGFALQWRLDFSYRSEPLDRWSMPCRCD
jgi:hypothetical protein